MPTSHEQPDTLTVESQLPAGVKGITIDPAQLRDHVMRPPHLEGVITDRGLDEDPGTAPALAAPIQRGLPKHLDSQGFVNALHQALKDDVIGYVMRLQQHGSTIQTLFWNWAQTPADDSLAWSPDRQMHVASVSKLITAMAMTRLLDDHKISYNAPIIDHLPTFWKKGPNIDKITFRNLLTHTSGFVTQNGKTDFETMKAVVELIGVSTDPAAKYHLGKYQYENMNFGLCRILIPIINGNIDKNALISDSAWDLATILGYGTYTAVKVLAPAGVTQATFDHPAGGALAYSLVPIAKGWNSGYLGTVSGAAGWHFSANELLRVMGTFRRKGTILSPTGAQQMLDNSFGIDVIQNTPAGTLYNKNGRWQDGSFRTEQAVAYFLPEDMEMTVMVNSLVGVTQKSLSKLVTNLYLANLK